MTVTKRTGLNLIDNMKWIASFFLLISISLTAFAQPGQDHNLAIQYYNNGEFVKAAELFEKLFEENNQSLYYYRYLYNSLLQLQEYQDIEKLIKKQRKRDKENLGYMVDLGYLYTQEGKLDKAKKEFEGAIESLEANRSRIMQLANAFMNIREYEYAVKVYKRGQELINEPFYLDLANLYRQISKDELMISNYLDYLMHSPQQLEATMSRMGEKMNEDEFYRALQKQLYARIQEHPQEIVYNEALIWLFIQKNDYESAFIQVKALDRRLKGDGRRVYNLGTHALRENHYDAAIEAFEYVIEKGASNRYYFASREAILIAKNQKILNAYDQSMEQIRDLKKDYQLFIEEFGQNRQRAAKTLKGLAQLEAFYLHDLDEAIGIVEGVVETPGLQPSFIAECKLDLGDYYLMKGEIWEATLLYSQVDKKMKDDPLGELARFKNAKLAFYNGDFEWSQAQLNVLKASTSELIANDALDLSVFITTHLGLDTTTRPLRMFARADLLRFQNKYDQTMVVLDSINELYPGHGLGDDMLFMKAKIKLKNNDPEQAVLYLQKLHEDYDSELLADDALFMLGKIYEERLQNKELAMEFYQELILNHKGSIYIVEARKRFRALRGDELN